MGVSFAGPHLGMTSVMIHKLGYGRFVTSSCSFHATVMPHFCCQCMYPLSLAGMETDIRRYQAGSQFSIPLL